MYLWQFHERGPLFAVVYHSETVTGHFLIQETKRMLDKVDMYLQSILENKQQLCIMCAAGEHLCTADKDIEYEC